MFKSLTVQSTCTWNVFTVNDLTIHCNLSRKAIGQEFDMFEAKLPNRQSILFKVAITQLNIEINHYAAKSSFLSELHFRGFLSRLIWMI